MAMEKKLFKQFELQLERYIAEINMRRYEDFLKLMKFDQNLITRCEKIASPHAEKFIYPFETYLIDAFEKINKIASLKQQVILLPLLLYMFKELDGKVAEFKNAFSQNKYMVHLCKMNANIQAMLYEEPMIIMQEKIANRGVNQKLILIIKHLKTNISGQKNDRKSNYYSQWKVDLFTEIENKLTQTDSLSDSEIDQYIADIREVCGKKRNSWHLWSEPHSVAEFNALLAASSLTDTSDTTSEPEPAPGM